MLAQGSGFVANATDSRSSFALVSGHVAAPHRWRQYFGHAEFLKYVSDKHCETRLHLRSDDGKPPEKDFMRVPLATGFAHSSLDIAAFACDKPGLVLRDKPLEDGEELVVHGHTLLGIDGVDGVIPTAARGVFVCRDGTRGFVNTQKECEMGMCGGPVLDGNGNIVGMLEGVVPRLPDGTKPGSELHARVVGTAVFIGAQEIELFLGDVDKALKASIPGKETGIKAQ